jgi:hypothetical protein
VKALRFNRVILVSLVIQITNYGPQSKPQNNNNTMDLKQCARVGDKSTWFSVNSVAWFSEYGLKIWVPYWRRVC